MHGVDINNIPNEKLQFANRDSLRHDKKLETKPIGYFRDAFNRFCKNKGSVVAACIIICMVLFSIITPFCTPYTVRYKDNKFAQTLPKSPWFKNTSFWDGCEEKEVAQLTFEKDYLTGEESKHYVVKNQNFTVQQKGTVTMYKYRYDWYTQLGCIYKDIDKAEYENIQKYQDETGIQVIYPFVLNANRPQTAQDVNNANYYYKTKNVAGKTAIDKNAKGEVQLAYWKVTTDRNVDDYTSKVRIENRKDNKEQTAVPIAKDNFVINGETYKYAYAYRNQTGYQVRINYYEYYIYYHTYVLKDNIKEPMFLFGTTTEGQDILTCLSTGARFSFIFAICVAVINLFIGTILGSIQGYYGGKIDIFMQRFTEILSAVPFMIVITLLKYHFVETSPILLLFIAFFITGWIGMAGSTRMQFYRFKNQEYVLAARTLGARDRRLMWKHIFPNAIGTLVTGCALVIPGMIYSETNLTYLGIIRITPDTGITSVGTLIADGQKCLSAFPHVAMFPSLFLALLMLTFNLFGNGLRDAFNPSLRGSE